MQEQHTHNNNNESNNNYQQQQQNQYNQVEYSSQKKNGEEFNYPTVNCIYHPSYFITNFCSDLRCLLPLCPQCVKVHIQEHRQKGTYGEIDTIDSIYDKTINQVKLCQTYYQQKQEKIQLLKNYKESVLDDLDSKLSEMKQQVYTLVEQSFIQIRSDLQDKTNQYVKSQIEQLLKIQEKNLEKESFFENYMEGLYNPQKCLKYLIKYYSDGIYSQNQQDIRTIDRKVDTIQSNDITLHINQDKIKMIQQILCGQVVHVTTATDDSVLKTNLVSNKQNNQNNNNNDNSNTQQQLNDHQIMQLQQHQQFQNHQKQIQDEQQKPKINIISSNPPTFKPVDNSFQLDQELQQQQNHIQQSQNFQNQQQQQHLTQNNVNHMTNNNVNNNNNDFQIISQPRQQVSFSTSNNFQNQSQTPNRRRSLSPPPKQTQTIFSPPISPSQQVLNNQQHNFTQFPPVKSQTAITTINNSPRFVQNGSPQNITTNYVQTGQNTPQRQLSPQPVTQSVIKSSPVNVPGGITQVMNNSTQQHLNLQRFAVPNNIARSSQNNRSQSPTQLIQNSNRLPMSPNQKFSQSNVQISNIKAQSPVNYSNRGNSQNIQPTIIQSSKNYTQNNQNSPRIIQQQQPTQYVQQGIQQQFRNNGSPNSNNLNSKNEQYQQQQTPPVNPMQQNQQQQQQQQDQQQQQQNQDFKKNENKKTDLVSELKSAFEQSFIFNLTGNK